MLDRLYLASKSLQSSFSFQLGGKKVAPTGKEGGGGGGGATRLLAESLVADTIYNLETHTVPTQDGFMLVLHRLVPKVPDQPLVCVCVRVYVCEIKGRKSFDDFFF